jgi:hypothetical protein
MTTEICQSSRGAPRLFAAGRMAVDAEDYDGNGRPSLHGRARLMLEVGGRPLTWFATRAAATYHPATGGICSAWAGRGRWTG